MHHYLVDYRPLRFFPAESLPQMDAAIVSFAPVCGLTLRMLWESRSISAVLLQKRSRAAMPDPKGFMSYSNSII